MPRYNNPRITRKYVMHRTNFRQRFSGKKCEPSNESAFSYAVQGLAAEIRTLG